ncbi:RNA polymerase sigma factor sigC isoform X1 [Phoenix dactylifera]|uniref:RNA polymerase sigma factor sigC isoform X1 n=2 Tax=Phoenix dactylifera TaxID=42345 RepID=A0A8B7CI33_PHODC|nr:RNA polymerase sigma factor sigC isoform X1 [Phoenix dactylifera]
MGFGFMVASKRWAFPIQSPLPTNPCTRLLDHQHHPPSSFFRVREAFSEPGKVSLQHLFTERVELLHRDTSKACVCSFEAPQSIENMSADANEVNMDRKLLRGAHDLNRPINMMENDSTAYHARLTASSSLQYNLLMENLDRIEDVFAGTDLVRMQRDILVHIRRLGALKLFHACLSRTRITPTADNSNFLHSEHSGGCSLEFPLVEQKHNIIVRSGKKKERKLRRRRALERASEVSALLGSSKKNCTTFSLPTGLGKLNNSSESRKRRVLIARNESEMSRGVKEVANLERTCIKLEEKIGQPASYARWAEAAGIDQKTLHQRLQFGWYCRDELIKSTRSLVIYLARKYRGMGIAFDDLLQAGNLGVLNGAERFDNKRGYKFSTYVQYWIRKSMLAVIARHSKGIQIPVRMEKIIKQIQEARRDFSSREGRYPRDEETAEFTGLSLDKVRLARKCSRTIGSIEQEIGDGWCTKFMEITPDTSLKAPSEIVVRQHMREDIFEVLKGLHPREMQVLVLRYGLDDGRCKSLEEIGRLFHVTKEWIRKLEKAALSKIRREEIQRELKHYLHS